MAKLSSVQKNLNRLKLIEKFSNKRKALKKKIMDKTISIEVKLGELPEESFVERKNIKKVKKFLKDNT